MKYFWLAGAEKFESPLKMVKVWYSTTNIGICFETYIPD